LSLALSADTSQPLLSQCMCLQVADGIIPETPIWPVFGDNDATSAVGEIVRKSSFEGSSVAFAFFERKKRAFANTSTAPISVKVLILAKSAGG
jgi:hypothetical protein